MKTPPDDRGNLKICIVNGYLITFNGYLKKFQTSHDKIGVCEEFDHLVDAVTYCRKG